MKISTVKRCFSAISVVAAAAVSAAFAADSYQFIVSGYPVENNASSLASEPMSLATSTLTSPTDAAGLEARYRVWYESDGTALRSDKFIGMFLYIR